MTMYGDAPRSKAQWLAPKIFHPTRSTNKEMSSASFQMKGAAYRKTLIKRFAICCAPQIFILFFQSLVGMAEVVKRGLRAFNEPGTLGQWFACWEFVWRQTMPTRFAQDKETLFENWCYKSLLRKHWLVKNETLLSHVDTTQRHQGNTQESHKIIIICYTLFQGWPLIVEVPHPKQTTPKENDS